MDYIVNLEYTFANINRSGKELHRQAIKEGIFHL